MNLTILQMIFLLQRNNEIEANERREILTKLLKTLKKKNYTHDKKTGIIIYYNIKDNKKLDFKVLQCELSQFKRKYDFFNVIEQITEKEKNKNIIVSDGDFIFFYNNIQDNKFYYWKQSTVVNEVKKYVIKYILKDRIVKKFDRLSLYLEYILNKKQSVENWKCDKTLDKCLSIMKEFNIPLCFKFWSIDDDNLKHAEFYKGLNSYNNITEYIEIAKRNALLKLR